MGSDLMAKQQQRLRDLADYRDAEYEAAKTMMLAEATTQLQLTIRAAYVKGWWWGLVCGLICGVCTTGTAVWLWHLVLEALGCPAC